MSGSGLARTVSFVVLTHGGAASSSAHRDGTDKAARVGMDALRAGGAPLDAVVEACRVLEDDERFNAGTGSNLRFDGRTIEMDAALMDSNGRFGGVACVQNVRHPVLVARAVLESPHNLLVGAGATRLARKLGLPQHDPWTQRAQDKFDRLKAKLLAGGTDPADCEWDLATLEKAWNYDTPFSEALGEKDTVGAVATDGARFAAALSTGGTMATLLGRVGDVPLPGCGLHAGPAGAVCVTGDGDHLARALLASRVYAELERGTSCEAARDKAISLFPPRVDVGLILVTRTGSSGGSNRDMAWSALVEDSA